MPGKLIGNAISQRRFRPDDSEVDFIFFGYSYQRFDIGGAYIQVLGYLCCAGITGSDQNLFNFGALGYFPC